LKDLSLEKIIIEIQLGNLGKIACGMGWM